MSASAALVRKDLRLSCSAVVPSLSVLVALLFVVLWGHHLPEVGRMLWGSGGTPPSVPDRIGTLLPLLVGGLALAALWTAASLAHGDRAHGAGLLVVVVPVSDTVKVLSKLGVLAMWIGAFAVLLALELWTSRDAFGGKFSDAMYLLVLAPLVGAACGLAASTLMRSAAHAVLLGLVLPLVGIGIAWGAVLAFTQVPSVPDSVSRSEIQVAFHVESVRSKALGVVLPWTAAVWLLLLIALGCRRLAGLTAAWSGGTRVGVAVAAAVLAALTTAGVAIHRDGRISYLRAEIAAREVAAERARQMSFDELIAAVYDQFPHLAPGYELSVARELLLVMRNCGILEYGESRRQGWQPPNSIGEWMEVSPFVRGAHWHELADRRVRLPTEFKDASVRFLTDATRSINGRVRAAMRSPALQDSRVALACVLLATDREDSHVLAVYALASLRNATNLANANDTMDDMNWCQALRRARQVLQAAETCAQLNADDPSCPQGLAEEARQCIPILRRAVAALARPLPELAAMVEKIEADPEGYPAGVLDQLPATVECLRRGLSSRE